MSINEQPIGPVPNPTPEHDERAFAVFEGHAPFGTQHAASFADLFETILQPREGAKDALALVFCDLRETTCNPATCSREHRIHGTGRRATSESVVSVTRLAFDVDEATKESVAAWFKTDRPRCIVWPTHSTLAGTKTGIGLRIVFETTRPIQRASFKAARREAIRRARLDMLVRADGSSAVDDQASAPANKFYCTAPAGKTATFASYVKWFSKPDGEPLDLPETPSAASSTLAEVVALFRPLLLARGRRELARTYLPVALRKAGSFDGASIRAAMLSLPTDTPEKAAAEIDAQLSKPLEGLAGFSKVREYFPEIADRLSVLLRATRPIRWDPLREYDATDQAIEALGSNPRVYQRAGGLVHLTRAPRPPSKVARGSLRRQEGTPLIRGLRDPGIRENLSRVASFLDHEGKPVPPPGVVIQNIAARGEWPGVRPLESIADFPVVRADGSIATAAGYDPETGVYIATRCDYVPFEGTAQEAARYLLTEVFGDFPFASDADRAGCLAALLTPLARHAFDGCTPLFLFDKNAPGTGGSLLCDLIGLVVHGRKLPRMMQATDEEEEAKRLLAIALEGDPIVLIDNITRPLGNGALDAAITSGEVKGRVLGESRNATAPWNCILFATGNNVELASDITRRVLRMRLECQEERPEERTNWRHPSIETWVLENRGRLLGASLCILSSHLEASGHPDLPAWGSFEAWSAVVRGAVVAAGLVDPFQTRRELAAADPGVEEARALNQALKEIGALDLASAKTAKEVLFSPLLSGRFTDKDAHAFGNRLRKFRKRTAGGRQIVGTKAKDHSDNTARWYSTEVG